MYDNQNEVDEIEKQIQQIFPNLRISSFGLDENIVINFGITLPVKGNGKVIKRLEELGWKKLCRQKKRTDNNQYIRCQYAGYVMYQCMQLDI